MAEEANVEVTESEKRGEHFRLTAGEVELGYMTFKRVHEEGIIVDHTIVHPEAQGQGAGGKLFEAMRAWVEERDLYLVPVCPYVLGRLEKYPEKGDARAIARGPLEAS
jgi:predicted GNAT family acetyltransferase